MEIAVLSDTHDHLANILHVLEVCRGRQITTLIHCGDLTGLEMVSYFEGFRVIYTTGNMDYATGAIKRKFNKMRDDNFVGGVYKGFFDGVPIAATHGDVDSIIMDLIRHMGYKWIFHGHTHQRRNEVIRGIRIVNPGALGGLGRESRSFCIVDLTTENVEFINV